LPLTVAVELNTGVPEQMVSVGPCSSKEIVPVGPNPPLRWAVSEMVPPMAMGPDAVVVSTVLALATMTLSAGSLQAVVAGVLLASPLYAACHW
jgi:hypothetical protein